MFALSAIPINDLIDRYEGQRTRRCEETTALANEIGWRIVESRANAISPITRKGYRYELDSQMDLVRSKIRNHYVRPERVPCQHKMAAPSRWRGRPLPPDEPASPSESTGQMNCPGILP